MRRGGGGQRQDEWVGWLRVGGRGGRSPRLRANVQVRIKVQRVLRLLLPPQLGYEREVRKAGGPRGGWPPPSLLRLHPSILSQAGSLILCRRGGTGTTASEVRWLLYQTPFQYNVGG